VEENEIKLDVHYNGAHDVIIDLQNSLSTVKSLSDLGSQVTYEVTLIAYALDILMQNQDYGKMLFFSTGQRLPGQCRRLEL